MFTQLLKPSIPVYSLLLLLASCTSFKSRLADVDIQSDGKARAGREYFLPKAMIDILGAPGSGGGIYTVAVTKRMVADKRQRFWLSQIQSGGHDQHFTYEVNNSGLVDKEVSADSTSKIDSIMVNLVDTASNIGQIYGKAHGFLPMGATTGAEAPVTPKPFHVQFDPYVKTEVDAAKEVMRLAGFKLDVESLRRGKLANAHPRRSLFTGKPERSEDGIYYRPQTTVGLTVSLVSGEKNLLMNDTVSIPDQDDIALFQTRRGMFTHSVEKATFANGELVKVDSNQPSEVEGFTQIPLKVTAAILKALPSVGSLLWRDPNADLKAQTARVQADTERLRAEQALLQQRQQNQNLRNQLGPDVAGPMAAGLPSAMGASFGSPSNLSGLNYKDAEYILTLSKDLAQTKQELADVKAKVNGTQGATGPMNGQPINLSGAAQSSDSGGSPKKKEN